MALLWTMSRDSVSVEGEVGLRNWVALSCLGQRA